MKKQLWALIIKEFLLLSRDRHATVVLFLMPVVFIFILSVALQDVFADKANAKVTLQIVGVGEGKEFAGRLSDVLKNSNQIQLIDETSQESAKARLTITEASANDFKKI